MQTRNSASRALASIIENSNGKFFTVGFVKKDGSFRQMTARLGVGKYLRGGKRTTNPDQFICVFEPSTGSYKNINKDTIVSVSSAGVFAVNTKV